MIALTKVLFEDLPRGVQSNSPEGQRALKIAQWETSPPGTPHPDAVARVAAQEKATQEIRQVAAAASTPYDPVIKPSNMVKPIANVSQATADHRATFNSLPDKGKNLRIAGVGQKGGPVNPADQATYDAAHKQIVAKRLAGGVPSVAAKTDTQPVQAVQKVVTKTTNQDMTGPEHLAAAAKKGVHAVGDAASSVGSAVASGAKHVASLAGEHPALAGVAAGAAGALGLRKLLSKDKKT